MCLAGESPQLQASGDECEGQPEQEEPYISEPEDDADGTLVPGVAPKSTLLPGMAAAQGEAQAYLMVEETLILVSG